MLSTESYLLIGSVAFLWNGESFKIKHSQILEQTSLLLHMNVDILQFLENCFSEFVRSIRMSMFNFVITTQQMTIQQSTLCEIFVTVVTSKIFQENVDVADPTHVVVVLN